MQVNNIIIDNDLTSLDKGEYNITCKKTKIILNILDDIVINDYSCELNTENIEINLQDNSSLIYNKYTTSNLENCTLNINQANNSKFTLNFSLASATNVNLVINNNLIGNNNKSKISLRALSKHNNIIADVSAKVFKETKANEIIEDLKGLNLEDGKITINPKLLIDSDDVNANHLMTISNINESQLFALMSKGLTRKDSINLLQKGFLFAILPDKNK